MGYVCVSSAIKSSAPSRNRDSCSPLWPRLWAWQACSRPRSARPRPICCPTPSAPMLAPTPPTTAPRRYHVAHSSALDTATGDGCLASQVSDRWRPSRHPHRQQGQSLLHRQRLPALVSSTRSAPTTSRMTIFAGTQNTTASKASCSAKLTAYGDGCTSTDGAANANLTAGSSSSNGFTLPALRPTAASALVFNGDFYIAGYNDDYDHRIAASTHSIRSTVSSSTATCSSSWAARLGTAGSAGAALQQRLRTCGYQPGEIRRRGISADRQRQCLGRRHRSTTFSVSETNGIVYNATATQYSVARDRRHPEQRSGHQRCHHRRAPRTRR
jgi:hypothetical protein